MSEPSYTAESLHQKDLFLNKRAHSEMSFICMSMVPHMMEGSLMDNVDTDEASVSVFQG